MPRMSRRLRPVALGLAVIVILLVVVPRNSSAQTVGSLNLSGITHGADGTIVASLTGSNEELASLSVFVDGEPVPFEVSDGETSAASRVILAIENSVSMTPAQLFEVQSAANGLVASLNPADEVALVTFGGGATVALAPTTDRAAFDAAINAIGLDGGSALYSGVTTAGELAAGNPSSLIVLVTYGWDWGSVSTHTREASIAAVSDAGASVYVQSMVFDGSVDIAYLAPLASDGVVRDATQVAAIAGASSILGTAAPARTLTLTSPPLPLGEHQIRIASDTGAERVATFEVVNDGLLTASVTAGAEPADPISVQVTSLAGLELLEVSATLDGVAVELGADGSAMLDPWALAPGNLNLEVTASVDGALAGSTAQTVRVPALTPLLTVDQSDDQALTATLFAQPGTADTLVATIDGVTVAESAAGSLIVDRPETGTLTFEARSLGQAVASEQVSATEVVVPPVVDPPVDNAESGSSIWTSPTMLLIPAALILVAFVLGRRKWPRAAGVPAVDAPQVGVSGLAEPSDRPIPLPVAEKPLMPQPKSTTMLGGTRPPEIVPAPAVEPEPEFEPDVEPVAPVAAEPSKSRFGLFDRGAKGEGAPTPIRPAQWVVVVRAPDGQSHRVEVGYEPVSIGASKLCTVTLEGDAVRFVHLVVAREGREVKAHQFGPVTVNGQDRNVEDEETLTNAVMEIGDVAIWLERAVAQAAAVDAA